MHPRHNNGIEFARYARRTSAPLRGGAPAHAERYAAEYRTDLVNAFSEDMERWLETQGVDAEFLRFADSVHTVEQAVKVSGHPVERFTKSIVMLTPNDDVVIAMVPAECRASTERVRKALRLEERPRVATASETEKHIGQQVGGNSPLNVPDATVLIDPQVLEKGWILTGGGDDKSLVKIGLDELRRIVEFKEVRVRK